VLTLSGHTGSVVKWQSSVAPFSVWTDIANTTATYTSGALTQETHFRAVVQSGNCSVENSLFATVTVLPASVGGIVSGGTTICSGSVSGLLTASGQTGNVVKWQSSVSPFSTWTDISNTTTAYTSGALADTIQFRVVVQSGGCPAVNSASTLVTVTPTVSIPEFNLGATSTRCQGVGSVTYTATSVGTTGLTYSLDAASLTGGNTVDAVSGLVNYVAGWSGPSIITVNAAGCNGPAIAAHNVTVTATPAATISYPATICNADLTSLPVVLTGSTGGIFSAPEGLKIDPSNGSITPGLSVPGTYTVSYSIAASGGCNAYSNSAQIQILGIPVLESVVVKNVTCTGSADGSLVARAATGTFTYEWTGPASYTNTGSVINKLAPGIYTLKITNANGCFLLTNDTIRESAVPLSLALTETNPSKSKASDGKIDAIITGGTQPSNYLWTGPDSFTSTSQNLVGLKYGTYNLQVTDKNGCVKSGVRILIDPPMAVDDTISTIEDIPITFNIVSNDIDYDGTIISSTIDLDPLNSNQQTTVEVPNKGAFTVSATGEVAFTPVAHFVGLVAIQYIVMDNNGVLSNPGKITVTVKSNNRAPLAVDDNFTVAEHNTATGNIFSNDLDPEGEPLTLVSFTLGSNSYLPGETATIGDVGTIVIISDGTFTFIPFQHYNGSVPQINYKVIDKEGLSASANLNITVSPVNDSPIAVDDIITTRENEKVEGNILNNDYDIENDAIILITLPIVAPAHGKLVLSANGDFMYQPVMDFIGNDKFTYQICDNVTPSLCSIATVTIVVTKNDSCEIFVPNVFTPNADGVHDYLKIRCLYLYDNPEMQIFNRNGNLIFKKDHYGNLDFWGSEDEAFWNGRSENKWNLMNDVLPVGTYYYILKLGDGKVLTGFIFLGK
ncbi:MAG: tandem-95 repeat protein, partial [Mariniphaga sp.]|nr:tandem-95 repeat protein [Mariniphaga sp.]